MQLRDMPLNSRAIWTQLSLVPNVLQASAGSTIRFSGSRSNQSHWNIDGTSMSDGVDAEFGTIGQVTMVTKSGTNSSHGACLTTIPRPGSALGIRSRRHGRRASLIFQAAVQGVPFTSPRFMTGVTGRSCSDPSRPSGEASPPSRSIRTFRFCPGGPVTFPVFRHPSSTLRPAPHSRIIAFRRTASIRLRWRFKNRFYPEPNFGSAASTNQNYRTDLTLPAMEQNYYMIRGDHRFSDKDSVMGRYTLQDFKTDTFTGTLPTIPPGYVIRKNHAATVAYTRTFSPVIVNELRWGIATNNLPIFPRINGREFVQEFGIRGLAPDLPDVPGILNVRFAGLALTNIGQSNFRNPGATNHVQNIQDHISIFRGRHNMKFGFNIARIEADNYGAGANLFGNLQFSNRYTGHPYADFLLGLPSTASRSSPPLRVDRRRWQYDFFYTGNFKITSKLSLDYGLRYEYHPGWQEDNGYLSMFDIGTGQDCGTGRVHR